MDWSKAKNVLIIIFIALNIFLLANIVFYNLGQGISEETILNTERILRNGGIVVQCDIPTYNSPTSSIDYESYKFDKQQIKDKLFGEGVDNSDKKQVEKYVRKVVKDIGINLDSYILDQFTMDINGMVHLVFIEQFDGLLVFDNYVKIILSESGITYFECSFKKVRGLVNEKQDIIPAHQILLKNYSGGGSVVITGIDMGFKGYSSDSNTKKSSQSPVWRITEQGGVFRFFSAIDGTEILRNDEIITSDF